MIERFDELQKLDNEILEIFDDLDALEPTTEDYAAAADQLTKLMKIKEIIGNLQLKEYEATTKREDAESQISAKVRELDLKATDLDLKERELEQKRQDEEDSYALRKRELLIKEKEADKPDRISRDTLVMVAANLAGIAMIIGYERMNIIASKALGFVLRSR